MDLAEPVQVPLEYVPQSVVIALVPSLEPKVIVILELVFSELTVKYPPPYIRIAVPLS